MTTSTLQRHKHNGQKKIHQYANKVSKSIRPLKKMNKNIVHYVHKKPYKTAGIATLFVGVVAGLIYAKFFR